MVSFDSDEPVNKPIKRSSFSLCSGEISPGNSESEVIDTPLVVEVEPKSNVFHGSVVQNGTNHDTSFDSASHNHVKEEKKVLSDSTADKNQNGDFYEVSNDNVFDKNDYDEEQIEYLGKQLNQANIEHESLISERRRSVNFESADNYSTSRKGSINSSSSRKSMTFKNIWGKFTKQDELWDSSTIFDEDPAPFEQFLTSVNESFSWFLLTMKMGFTSPIIMFTTLCVFALLCASGISTIVVLAKTYERNSRAAAEGYAFEMGSMISRKLDEAILPLFTMSQFVHHLKEFQDLPRQIGPRGGLFSAPPQLPPKNVTHRNVTGICDDPFVNETFTDIARNVKRDAQLDEILVNVQLAPFAVVCLVYPVYNTEDFEDGIFLDNRGAIGHDLLNDPNRVKIAEATIPGYPDVVTAGPLTLIQNGTPKIRECLIARLAIFMDGYSITLPDGVEYPCWGFAVVLLNWEKLKEKSGVNRFLAETGLEYHLTRTDLKPGENGTLQEVVVTIGNSSRYEVLGEANSVSVELDTTNNLWKMTVGYEEGFRPDYMVSSIATVVIVCLLLSMLLMVILVVKKQHQILLYKMMPKRIIKRLQLGKTVIERYELASIYFSDIAGFTSMSSEMTPGDVMQMLNELYTEFDKLVIKHGIYKVETIGDAYIAIAGGPDGQSGRDGAERLASFALDVIAFVKEYKTQDGSQIYIRAGIGTGPVVAGVVGTSMPKFTLFGDTVNFSSRMESTGKKLRIQVNEMTYRTLRDAPNYDFELEKRIEGDKSGVFCKGIGHVPTWWLNSKSERGPVILNIPTDDKFA